MKFIFAVLAIIFVLAVVANAQITKEEFSKARQALINEYPALKTLSDTYNGDLKFLALEGRNDPKCSNPIITKFQSEGQALVNAALSGSKTVEDAVYEEFYEVTPNAVKKLQGCLVEANGGTYQEAEKNYLARHPEEDKVFKSLMSQVISLVEKEKNSCIQDLVPELYGFDSKPSEEYVSGESLIAKIVHKIMKSSTGFVEKAEKCLNTSSQITREEYNKQRQAILEEFPHVKALSVTYNGQLKFLVLEGRNDPKCSNPIVAQFKSEGQALVDAALSGSRSVDDVVYDEFYNVTPRAVKKLQGCLVEANGGTYQNAEQNYLDSHLEENEKFRSAISQVVDLLEKEKGNSCVQDLIPEVYGFDSKPAEDYFSGKFTIARIVREITNSSAQFVEKAKKCLNTSSQITREEYNKQRQAVLDENLYAKVLSNNLNGELKFLVLEGHNDPKCSDPIVAKFKVDGQALVDAVLSGSKTVGAAVADELYVITPRAVKQLQRCLVEANGGTYQNAQQNYLASHSEEDKVFKSLTSRVVALLEKAEENSCIEDLASELYGFDSKPTEQYVDGLLLVHEIVSDIIKSSTKFVEKAEKCLKTNLRGF